MPLKLTPPPLWHSKEDDTVWMTERKNEWRLVKKNLVLMSDYIPRRLHHFHKHLFFTGEFHPDYLKGNDNYKAFGGVPALFQMWYHPEPSTEELKKIFDGLSTETALYNMRRLLFAFQIDDFTTEYGLFGGREELMVKALYPELDYKRTISFNDNRSSVSLGFLPRDIYNKIINHSLTMLKLSERYLNPYNFSQYLWDYFLYAMKNYSVEIFSNNNQYMNRDINNLRFIMRLVADFDTRLTEPDLYPRGIKWHKFLLEQLENKQLPDFILDYWLEEKANFEAGKPFCEIE